MYPWFSWFSDFETRLSLVCPIERWWKFFLKTRSLVNKYFENGSFRPQYTTTKNQNLEAQVGSLCITAKVWRLESDCWRFFIFFNKSRTFWSSFNGVIDWSFLYFVVLVPSPLLLIPCHRSFLDSWRHSCYHSFAVRLCSFISWLIFQDHLYWKVTSKSRTENKGEKPNYCLEGWSSIKNSFTLF